MKVAFIGASGHQGLALEAAGKVPDLAFLGMAAGGPEEDVSAWHARSLAPLSVPLFDDWRVMLDRVKPDVAVVAPWFHRQASIGAECLRRGIHVFLEKPLATTPEDLEALRAAWKEGRVRLCPMLALRWAPAFWAAFRAVRDGLVGEPLVLHAQKSYRMGDRPKLYHERATYGGTVPWVGIHGIDWIHWFTGGRILDVTARHTTRDNGGFGTMESSGMCLFRLENSGAATLSIDFFRPAAAPSHGDDRIRAAGSRGVVEVIDGKATLVTASEAPRLLDLEPTDGIFADFLRHVRDGAPLRVGAEEAFSVADLALKSREAADTGRTVAFRGGAGDRGAGRVRSR